MDLIIGMEVRFLNEPISGKVIGFGSKGLVEVETEDGFIIRTAQRNLVKVHPMEETVDHFMDLSESIRVKEGFSKIKTPENESSEIVREFDLHIEELGVPYRTLTNYEILNLQLQVFENKLRQSINERISPITFIHGIGNGILRQEILKRLKKNHFVSHFENKGKDLNKFGATEVFLKT